MKIFIIFIFVAVSCAVAEKLDTDILKNYSEFFNFGSKKLSSKLERQKYENTIFKSKVDILGSVFKKNVDRLKSKGILDLVFLIDASSSVGEYNFKSELKFVKKLLSDVTVDFNHTRVAVVTFSSQDSIIINIDEISRPKDTNNKCLLLNNEINHIRYTGGGTYTVGAFKVAQEILQNSRKEAEKVLFLITDGFSNGGDPVPVANELKASDVTIFTIGILNGNYKELYQLSTEPGELYSYLLDSFEEFESLARRALHVDLQSGDYIALGSTAACDRLCNGTDCCDRNAICTCGTSTGHYSCLCKPGYYGSGLKNSCSPCPSNSYASGPNTCLPCPDIHHYTTTPANGVESCTCKLGYQATKNYGCEVIKCPKLVAPRNGYFVKRKDCSNVLNSACGVRCNVGYTLIGSSIRLCQVNATWSGHTPSCQVKTCSKINPPAFGSMTCIHTDLEEDYTDEIYLPVDTVCNFTCQRDRTLVGSSHRTCLPLAQWDGLRTACKVIKCNKLSKINFGSVEPKNCTIGKQPYGKVCQIKCNEGFELVGPKQKVCTGQHGTWDTQEEISCKDVTKPKLKCPNNVTGTTLQGKPYGLVDWEPPIVTENSNLNVTIWTKPAIKKKSEFKFKIGKTTVTYFALDASNNRGKCSFSVIIEDNEPPTIEGCIDPPAYLISNNITNITWDEPNIFDNSQNVQVSKSHDFGIFNLGTTEVTYTATDFSNNINICKLNITIQESKCEILPDPIFGHSECRPNSDSIQCVVTCEEGYALPLNTPSGVLNVDDNTTTFVCEHSQPAWNNQGGMFPECTVTEIPVEVNQSGVVSIETDSEVCENSTKINEYENDIKEILKKDCESEDCKIQAKATCDEKDLEDNEEITNIIKREIGRSGSSKKRGRRRRKKINVGFNFNARRSNKTGKIATISDGLAGLQRKNFSMVLDKPKIACPLGSFSRKFKCIRCPEGTFHNSTSNSCQSCQIGFYNNKSGQTECLTCPKYFSTRKLHAKSSEDCIEKCPPGTYARKKQIKHPKNHPNSVIERVTLKPYCSSCPIGYYQPNHGQTSCKLCPDAFTTLTRGANDINECILPCSQSDICNNGKCLVENDFYYNCLCEEGYIGSHCEIKLGQCDSNPCQNNGICIQEDSNYKCQCLQGYGGRNCAEVVEINSLLCQNGGIYGTTENDEIICLCPEGIGGEFCEIIPKYCTESLCDNGATCVEEKQSYFCKCIKGFIGRRCSYLPCDYRPCNENQICINLELSETNKNNFECICPPGYSLPNCTKMLDPCSANPCEQFGKCTNLEDGFKCDCPKGYSGLYCEIEMRSDYILYFPRSSVTDFIVLDGFDKNLTEISVCLWVKISDSFNYGTLLSYATEQYDNTFTITDYTGLVLYINNNYVVTDVMLNDGFWHHFCITWKSHKGEYRIFLDSKIIHSGNDLSTNYTIAGGGKLVIGQEQDILGGKFSQSEAYLGKMAHLDIYSESLSSSQIAAIMDSCKNQHFGDLYAWPEFAGFIQGDIQIQDSSFCQSCPLPESLINGKITVSNNTAYYSCNTGFIISNNTFDLGRKCTKAAKWEGTGNPYCKVVSCRHPGYITNGYTVGKSYDYSNEIVYKCNYGYNLTGNAKRICNADGFWKPEEPACLGIECKKFEAPPHSQIMIMDDDLEIPYDEISIIEIGTQIEISCQDGAELEGESTLSCQSDGQWDLEAGKCIMALKKLPCSLEHIPAPPSNGKMLTETLERVQNGLGDTIEYRCRDGYKLIGFNTSTCIVDGYWSELDMTCVMKTCDETPRYLNMILRQALGLSKPTPIGHTISYQCLKGYKPFGNMRLRCLLPGLWSRMQGKCIRISCGKPTVSEDSQILGNSYLFNDTIMLRCTESIHMLQCGSDGKWIGDTEGC